MAFLRKHDYFTEIREEDLDIILAQANQVTSLTPAQVRQEKEFQSQSDVEAMIRHRYDVRKIFVDVIPWAAATQFQINDLVEYSETAWDSGTIYVSGNRVSFQQTVSSVLLDDIWEATATTVAGESPVTTPGKWSKKTENFSLYHVERPIITSTPDTAFSYTNNNFTGNHDQILGWDKSKSIFFTRQAGQIRMYHSSADRTANNNSIGLVDFDPKAKQFPNNRPINQGTDLENTVSGELSIIGFIPDLTDWDVVPSNFYIKGDNRDRLIKNITLNLAIYQLHKLINPRNIPALRLEAKNDAMKMLTDIKKGLISPDLPIFFDPNKGQSIAFSSNRKRVHRIRPERQSFVDGDAVNDL